MGIPFKDETDIAGLKQAPYGLSVRDREAMNDILDELKAQDRMEKVPLGNPSPVASPAFVVWNKGKALQSLQCATICFSTLMAKMMAQPRPCSQKDEFQV